MKKIIISILLLLSISFLAESKPEFSMGLKIGFNAAKFRGSATNFPEINGYTITGNFKAAPGFHIGPYVRVGLAEKFRIQVEVLFSTKGSKVEINNGTIKEDYYRLPFYLDIPILFNYKPVAGLYFEAGFQPSFALTALNFSTNTTTVLSSAYLNTLDIAPVLGLGYEFKKISIGLRGAYGLSETNPIAPYTGATAKNMALMLTTGFKF